MEVYPYQENAAAITEKLTKFVDIISTPAKLLDWAMPGLYWITVIGCAVSIIYYAVTKSPKCLRIAAIVAVTYFILKGIAVVT